jgi:hypothetical protein
MPGGSPRPRDVTPPPIPRSLTTPPPAPRKKREQQWVERCFECGEYDETACLEFNGACHTCFTQSLREAEASFFYDT